MAGIAAALTVPPLVALYFLKLKRNVKLVPSTLLWKKSVEDLQVNSPFQRLRKSLLLLLQLLVLALAALALGKPMLETADESKNTVMFLIDQSASMGVIEEDGKTRLEQAKKLAKQQVDSMPDDARAMVIAFCDRAVVASSFDGDKQALKRKIDSIQQTQSTSTLGEAVSLAEAYAQNLVIGGEKPGSDIAPVSAAPPATVFLFTDGRIEDAEKVAIQKFDVSKIRVFNVGKRSDNVGILAMDARRHYEYPEFLEVTAVVRNFGPDAVNLDAVLYVDGKNVDVQTLRLDGAPPPDKVATSTDQQLGHIMVAAFDQISFEGSGVIEVVLRTDDALSADDRAWTIIDPPRRAKVLLVTPGNMFLEGVLRTLSVEFDMMDGGEYESASEEAIMIDGRSRFDVVMLDRHSTGRLPQGNYLFWGSAPKIEGVVTGREIDNEIIFDWDETNPVLRHVTVETIDPISWIKMTLPKESRSIIDGQTSPVLSYLAHNANQFLICAFGPIGEDELGRRYRNGNWVASADFVVLTQNMVNFLSSNLAMQSERSLRPGEPASLQIRGDTDTATIERPDNEVDSIPTGSYQSIHYARTRKVGVYRVAPGVEGRDVFAINLFNETESDVSPVKTITLGATSVDSQAGVAAINKPAWMYFLLGVLLFLLVEWVIYNQRVFV
jgi:von Willebrand factor type A domain/Aerotolerance regulator N-terminal